MKPQYKFIHVYSTVISSFSDAVSNTSVTTFISSSTIPLLQTGQLKGIFLSMSLFKYVIHKAPVTIFP